MIRREIRLADGSAGWMLISQIEHARISAQLAAHAISQFGVARRRAGSSPTPAPSTSVQDEVLAAIHLHDDGWREWERSPRLDAQLGRPLTFTELESEEALAIWSASIDSAETAGPLAASMVAGHFIRLLDHGDTRHATGAAVKWRAEMSAQRAAWLERWQAQDPAAHTLALAAEALQWLWTFDEVSLWFCTTCGAADGSTTNRPTSYLAGRDTPLEMQLEPAAAAGGQAVASPWHFDVGAIDIAASGQAAPAHPYADAQQLLAACGKGRLQWQLGAPGGNV